MQSTVLVVTLVLMAVVAFLFVRTVAATNGPSAEGDVNKRRTQLIWAMIVAGVIVSVMSLREWPHAIPAGTDTVVINVSGGQWYWDIDVEEVPLGKPVVFQVSSEDVNHGMGVFNADMQLLAQTQGMPGYINKVTYTFTEPGTYQVLCLEFCGIAHHDMISEFQVVAEGGR